MAAICGDLVDAENLVVLKDLLNRFGCENCCTEENFTNVSGSTDLRSNYLMNDKIVGIEEADYLLLIGTNPRFEAPVLNARIRKSWMHYDLRVGLIGTPTDLTYEYDHLGSSPKEIDDLLVGKHKFSKEIANFKRPMILLGSDMLQRSDGDAIYAAVRRLATNLRSRDATKSRKVFNLLHTSTGQVAALDIGYSPGLGRLELSQLRLLFLLGADRLPGLADRQKTLSPDCLVVYVGHHGDRGASIADVVLPGAAYTEKEATYVNTEGRAQKAFPAVAPPGLAREDWKILRALSEIAGRALPYDKIQEVRQRLSEIAPHLIRYGHAEAANFLIEADRLIPDSLPSSGSSELKPLQLKLSDFYMSNCVTRASRTMAKCAQAALAHEKSRYAEH